MRKFYIIYGVIALVAIGLKIIGLISWGWMLSFIWFPVAVLLSLGLAIVITNDIGQHLKKKEEAKIIPSCENCVFGKTKNLLGEDQCLGEKMGAEKNENICSYYAKNS